MRTSLNLDTLYPQPEQKAQFQARFAEFLSSDPANAELFDREGDLIVCKTECMVPEEKYPRPPLLLLFGNPASHSVVSEMFFSFEGNGREHRIWSVLDRADILSFRFGVDECPDASSFEYNQRKKEALFDLSYESPFRIGFAVYYSMPSGASLCPWAGVGGLRRLFGKRAFDGIGGCEKTRIEGIIRRFAASE